MLKWAAKPHKWRTTEPCCYATGRTEHKGTNFSIVTAVFSQNWCDCHSTEKVIFNRNNYWISWSWTTCSFTLLSFKAQGHRFITMSKHSSAPVWPNHKWLPHHWHPDANDMETDQLPTSRPFNCRPVRGNKQTATHTWHRPPVYVKGRKSRLAPKHCKHCAVPWGKEGAGRKRDELDAHKFRDLG